MQYHVRLVQSDEGWAVSCPALLGCHSQGETREEALDNIRIAIREWLEVEAAESGVKSVEEDLVDCVGMPKLPGISCAQGLASLAFASRAKASTPSCPTAGCA